MAEQKLTYKVEVDSSGAVRDLDKLGQAGEDAGKQIASGFDEASSKSKAAIAELTAQLDKLESDSKQAATAVSAIKAELSIDVDDSKVAGFVSDLRNKMGVAFDDITADAKQFAEVLERGVDLSRTTGEIRSVGDELGHVRSESDQSRSVLANLAGNTAQDLGELGGVVGSLGVGIGQLAEYAVDGNIALSNLASVAGPMAALALAGAGVQDVMANIAATKAFNADQVKSFNDAVAELGNTSRALADSLDGVFNARVDDNSLWGQLTNKQQTQDLSDNLASVGVTLGQIDSIIRSGASDRASFELLPGVQDLDRVLQNAGLSVEEYEAIMDGVFETTVNWTRATQGADDAAKFFGTTLQNVNDAIETQLVADDPFTRFRQGLFVTTNGVVDLQAIWNDVVRDMQDDDANFSTTGENVDILAKAMGRSVDEVIALARETAHAGKSMADMQTHTDAAADAADKFTKSAGGVHDALIGVQRVTSSADWGSASIQATADAMGQFFADAERAKDGVAGVQEALDNLAAAHETADTLLPDLSTGEGRQFYDALKELGTSLIPDIQQAFDDSRGSVDTFNQKMQGLYLRTLAQLSNQLGISTEDAALLLRQIGLVPENFSTQYELIGDDLAKEQLNLLQGVIDGLPEDVRTQVTLQITKGDYQGAVQTIINYANSHPATVPTNANTSGANADMNAWRNQQESTPVRIQVSTYGGGGYGGGPHLGGPTPSPYALPAPSAAAALEVDPLAGAEVPATTATGVPPVRWGPTTAPTPMSRQLDVTVNVHAGVIGNRFDVQRAVVKAMRSATRLSGQAALV